LALLTDLPGLVTDLIQAEIAQLKAEVTRKLSGLGLGAGLIVGAAVVLLFMIGVLLTAGILSLALVLPGWLAALLVALLLLIVAGILGWVGYLKLNAGMPPLPTETIDSLKKDLNVIRGIGK